MTMDEAARLKSGDHVFARVGGKRMLCVVQLVHVVTYNGVLIERRVSLRKPGLRFDGLCRNRIFTRHAADVDRLENMDGPTANIFADWLEERGEHRAAAMLREAFPFVDRNGNSRVPEEVS